MATIGNIESTITALEARIATLEGDRCNCQACRERDENRKRLAIGAKYSAIWAMPVAARIEATRALSTVELPKLFERAVSVHPIVETLTAVDETTRAAWRAHVPTALVAQVHARLQPPVALRRIYGAQRMLGEGFGAKLETYRMQGHQVAIVRPPNSTDAGFDAIVAGYRALGLDIDVDDYSGEVWLRSPSLGPDDSRIMTTECLAQLRRLSPMIDRAIKAGDIAVDELDHEATITWMISRNASVYRTTHHDTIGRM